MCTVLLLVSVWVLRVLLLVMVLPVLISLIVVIVPLWLQTVLLRAAPIAMLGVPQNAVLNAMHELRCHILPQVIALHHFGRGPLSQSAQWAKQLRR